MNIDIEKVNFEAANPKQKKVAATLIYDADPHLFAYWFKNDYETALKFFEIEWEQDRSFFSHTLCSVAVIGDKLLGIELGYGLNIHSNLLTDPDTGKTGSMAINPELLPHTLEVTSYVPYLFPIFPKDAYYIQSLSLLPEARGQGLGTQLLKTTFDRAKEKGYNQCQLDVASDNPAVNFYYDMGMEIISETRVIQLEKNGVPSHYRMVKLID
jgi:ribosomal protein S18 acetylase RimI-like enzyme